MRMREVAAATTAACIIGIERRHAHRLPLRSLGHQVIREVDGAEAEPLRHLRQVAQPIEFDPAELNRAVHARTA